MKNFIKNNWKRIACIVATIVAIVLAFFRPLSFRCSADAYITNRQASDWGISKNATASKYFDATGFSSFDNYLVNTLKIPAYSYGNFKFNLDLVIQLAIKDDMYNDFLADWEKVKAGTLARRDVVTFGTFDTDLLVHNVEYLGTENYTDVALVYRISNNQEQHYIGNYKVLNFKVTFNFGQSYDSQYRDVVWKEYAEVSIVYALTGCTGSTANPTIIYENSKDVPLMFSLQDGYTWDDVEISVNGLAYTWDNGYMFVDALPNVASARIAITAKKVAPSSYTLEAGTYKWVDGPVKSSSLMQVDFNFVSNQTSFTRFIAGTFGFNNGIYYRDSTEEEVSVKVYNWTTWTDTAYQTITLSASQTVSADFYEWAIAGGNLVKQEGETWVLNETLTAESLNDGGAITISFTSNGVSFRSIERYYSPDDDLDFLKYTGVSHDDDAHPYANSTWFDSVYRTITFTQPVTDTVLLTWLQANGTKQSTQSVQSDKAIALSDTDTAVISVIRDNSYNITIAPDFPSLKTKYFDTWINREFGFRITRANITFSGASRPQWVKPASGDSPTAYHVVLSNIMEYLAYYGYNEATANGTLYYTSYFSAGDTRYYYGESTPIGYNQSSFYDKFIRVDAFNGSEKSFFIDGFSMYLVGDGKESYGDFHVTRSGKQYQLFNYYRESDTDNSCDYPYSFEYYPLVSDNFGVSIGAGTGDIQGYDYNQFYMPLDDFNFFDLFKGATWYAILNNSIVWLCCELPLLSNLTRPLYTAARLTSNYLVQYIIPFFSATGIIGAAAAFVVLISVIWRWIKGND